MPRCRPEPGGERVILNSHNMKPIYVQIAEWLETEILNGHLPEEERIYSQYQLAEMFNVNPATAAKGLNLLADAAIVFKQRGLGMYVSRDAKQRIQAKRKNRLLQEMVKELVLEAKRLDVDGEELIGLIRQTIEESGDEKR